MTPEESQQIAAAGTVFFQNTLVQIFSFGWFGVYILAFMISMHIIWCIYCYVTYSVILIQNYTIGKRNIMNKDIKP
ncbi:hypothetical protein BT96DRAFT_1008291 [Gymnopus androsaceus JB14]|uniref:Uncharacterized protein n=1 Tax=Gymnopus androsaceus JB14 TaxID=1447944 RepID=A0A6A4GFC9_9AGAR|nr:hypothetical protein BT96DRAFT_1008291 [Gymnopus androsaceus JB14]